MSERELKNVPITLIKSEPTPSREVFQNINSLAATIERHGLIQPIVVKKNVSGYEIICGERRFAACKKAKLEKVPCIIINEKMTREQVLEWQLIENIHRSDLKVYEEIKLIAALRNHFKLTHDEIAVKVGVASTTAGNYLRISRLPEEYLRKIKKDSRHAKDLTVGKCVILANSKLLGKKGSCK